VTAVPGEPDELTVATPTGPARVVVREPVLGGGAQVAGTLVLGHGAGAGCETVDLLAVAGAAVAAGWRVLLVDQPWRVAGRRVAAPPPRLDEAWTAVLADPQVRQRIEAHPAVAARDGARSAGPLVVGGRSAGARVACRTATAVAADAVLCLAFPLHPPGRPEKSRAGELLAAAATHPVLVVQGMRDAFGSAEQVADRLAAGGCGEVVAVPGDHGLKADPAAVAAAVTAWLAGVAATPVAGVRNEAPPAGR